MNDRRKEVHSRNYDGPDRRNGGGQRASDKIAENLKLVGIALGIAISIFSFGGGWVATKMTLANKVDKADFAQKNAEQDAKIREALMRVQSAETMIRDNVIPELADIKRRARDIYCDGKPPGCQ